MIIINIIIMIIIIIPDDVFNALRCEDEQEEEEEVGGRVADELQEWLSAEIFFPTICKLDFSSNWKVSKYAGKFPNTLKKLECIQVAWKLFRLFGNFPGGLETL